MAHTRKVDEIEARVLGALLEKQRTTPDNYPLTVNSLVLACNQKSNRDPVTNYSEGQILDALDRLRRDVLVWRSEGARVERWEHRLVSRWHLESPQRAIMTMLLLRGPQTPGELRSRSERLHAFTSVDVVEETLRGMSQGENALVRELDREPGKRENRWVHVMGTTSPEPAATESTAAEETAAEATASEATASRAARPERPAARVARPARAEGAADVATIDRLEQRIDELEARLATLEEALL